MTTFSINPDLPAKGRRELASFLEETAARTGDPRHMVSQFVRVIAARLDDPGEVSIKIGQMDQETRLVARRVLYTAAERARGGEAGKTVAEAVRAILAAWEACIGWKAPRTDGPLNPWGEAVGAVGSRGLGGVWTPAAG